MKNNFAMLMAFVVVFASSAFCQAQESDQKPAATPLVQDSNVDNQASLSDQAISQDPPAPEAPVAPVAEETSPPAAQSCSGCTSVATPSCCSPTPCPASCSCRKPRCCSRRAKSNVSCQPTCCPAACNQGCNTVSAPTTSCNPCCTASRRGLRGRLFRR